MATNLIILYSFLSILVLILFSGYMVKVSSLKKAKKPAKAQEESRKIDFTLKGDIYELGKLAIILEDLERYQIPLKTILELNVIIEEVFVSIVNHQKGTSLDNKVSITLSLEPGQVVVSVRDRNEEFDPTLIEKIDLNAPIEEISFRGLGFHLVRHLADGVSYQRIKGENVLTVTKAYPI